MQRSISMSGIYTNIAKKRIAQSHEATQGAGRAHATPPPAVPSPAPTPAKPSAAKSNCQLNAWITTNQEQLLNTVYYRLRANRVKIKKGEVIGVAIEILSKVLEKQSPSSLDVSILDEYVRTYDKNT